MKRIVLALASLGWIALSLPGISRAEGFVDLRVGGAFTEDNDVRVKFGNASVDLPTQFEDSVTGGVRGGYWFDSLPWLGLAADVSYFAPDDDSSGGPEYDLIPISPLLMGRIPIATSEEFPNGRVQPFLGIGPGIFVSLIDVGSQDDDTAEVGVDLHAGVNVQVTRLVSLFAEYRFTYVEPEFKIQGVKIEPEFSTHHIGVGVGFHF
ncbi:MAG TPA: outer membrane beta-barrel protein [Myxococcota bacterium]|nr:outer membrane beta-barrel protein [Myxococcota bacterium]